MTAITLNKKQDVGFVALNMPNGGFTDDEFFEFCRLNDELKMERLSTGEIIIMSLTGGETSVRNSELNLEIGLWNRKKKLGKVFDSSGGFKLPNTAVRSPDAAWIPTDKWESLGDDQRKKFVPICPDFVRELASNKRQIAELKEKMQEYMDNGSRLGWLIDPFKQITSVYRSSGEIEEVPFDGVLSGEDVMEGLSIAMTDLLDV